MRSQERGCQRTGDLRGEWLIEGRARDVCAAGVSQSYTRMAITGNARRTGPIESETEEAHALVTFCPAEDVGDPIRMACGEADDVEGT